MQERLFTRKGTLSPFQVDLSFYEKYDYRVVVVIRMFHDHPRGTLREGQTRKPHPGRYYLLTYQPEEYVFDDGPEPKRQNNAKDHFEDFLSPEKEHITREQLSIGFVLVRRSYQLAIDNLKNEYGSDYVSKKEIFTAKDVLKAFPWIASSVLHHRVSKGFIPLVNEPEGQGIAVMFRLSELVHCGVVDELAALGAFNKTDRVNTEMIWAQ